jgi:hypothetical protein
MSTRTHRHTQCSYEGQTQGEVKFMSQIVPAKFEGRKIVLVDELVDNGRAQFPVQPAIEGCCMWCSWNVHAHVSLELGCFVVV